MRITMKVDYGVRALIDLAQNHDSGPVPTSDIARRQNIPEAYLDQVLNTLQKFGFIRSRRGPQGGHVLAKSPHEISLRMVMATLDGTASPLRCIEEPAGCSVYDACAQRNIWQSVDEAVQSVLNSISIGDLAQRQSHMASRGMYQDPVSSPIPSVSI